MSANVLSDDVVELISKLANIHERKNNVQERIDTLDQKLSMARETNLQLAHEEEELVTTLQAKGYYYGQEPQQPVQSTPVQSEPQQAPTSNLPSAAQDQLTALLSSLLNNQNIRQAESTPVVQQTPVTSIVPTSGSGSFGGNNFYNFPKPAMNIVPTSTQVVQQAPKATPRMSPTSAPGLAIRKRS